MLEVIVVNANCCCCCLRYVVVECEDQDSQQRDPKTQMYLNVMMRFSQALLKVRTCSFSDSPQNFRLPLFFWGLFLF